jgi:hypothetical protein
VIFAAAEIYSPTNAAQISCESSYDTTSRSYIGLVKTCDMSRTTTIAAEGFEFSSTDASITGLDFYGNKKIHFLPVHISTAFPNLLGYDASYCSLTTIGRDNFKGLNLLKRLSLDGNQIATIYSNTFVGLTSLDLLGLSKKIIFGFKLF